MSTAKIAISIDEELPGKRFEKALAEEGIARVSPEGIDQVVEGLNEIIG
jgi:hypothetical protein